MTQARLEQINAKAASLTGAEHDSSLVNWFDVVWFFPLGFRKREVVETQEFFFCYGEHEIYKFRKHSDSANETFLTFEEIWKKAVNEVLDNAKTAPGVYLGVRPLCFVDGEPRWLDIQPVDSLHPKKAAPLAHEVAIVLRRVEEGATLNRFLDNEKKLGSHAVHNLVSSLLDFHRQSTCLAIQKLELDPFYVSTLYYQRYIEEMLEFKNGYGSYLDPFSQVELTESMAYLSRFLLRHEDVFIARARKGFIVDSHGDLRSYNVVVEKSKSFDRKFSFINRPSNHDYSRIDDFLSDVASLVIDLEVKEKKSLAREIEEEYFGQRPTVYNKNIYRFHLVGQALRQARLYFDSQGFSNESAQHVSRCLSLAFYYTLNLKDAFILSVVERGDGKGRELAASLAELVNVEILEGSNFQSVTPFYQIPRPVLFERMLQCAEDLYLEGRSSILLWGYEREEEILDLQHFSDTSGIATLLVSSESQPTVIDQSSVEACDSWLLDLETDKTGGRWTSSNESDFFDYLQVEPLLTQADTALYVLNELKRLFKKAVVE